MGLAMKFEQYKKTPEEEIRNMIPENIRDEFLFDSESRPEQVEAMVKFVLRMKEKREIVEKGLDKNMLKIIEKKAKEVCNFSGDVVKLTAFILVGFSISQAANMVENWQ
jgi:hypothetical protein